MAYATHSWCCILVAFTSSDWRSHLMIRPDTGYCCWTSTYWILDMGYPWSSLVAQSSTDNFKVMQDVVNLQTLKICLETVQMCWSCSSFTIPHVASSHFEINDCKYKLMASFLTGICSWYCWSEDIWLFRAKDVDLTPYLTTRLVDDFASHIRLYRRSVAKVIEHRKDGKFAIVSC